MPATRASITSAPPRWSAASIDHSYVQRLVDERQITEEEANNHPQSNLLTGCLGTFQDPPLSQKHIDRLEIGDSVLSCSDGLWHYFTPRELGAIVHALAAARGDRDARRQGAPARARIGRQPVARAGPRRAARLSRRAAARRHARRGGRRRDRQRPPAGAFVAILRVALVDGFVPMLGRLVLGISNAPGCSPRAPAREPPADAVSGPRTPCPPRLARTIAPPGRGAEAARRLS